MSAPPPQAETAQQTVAADQLCAQRGSTPARGPLNPSVTSATSLRKDAANKAKSR
jgi:hypothetical protein